MDSAASGMQANSTPQPAQLTVVAIVPASPCSGNGLGTGSRVWVSGSGDRTQPTSSAVVPATAAASTGRQRRERNRPSGSSSSGRVTARVRPTAHRESPTRAARWAAGGSGRLSRSSWSTQGSQGTYRVQASPAAAYSQPIGLAGRRNVRTRPMVANSSHMAPSKASSTSTSTVSGRVTNRVTTSPPTRHAKVARNTSQASRVRLPRCIGHRLGLGSPSGRTGPTIPERRYGSVTARFPGLARLPVGDLGCDAEPASGEPAGMARNRRRDVDT
jgi:hypothetical protein